MVPEYPKPLPPSSTIGIVAPSSMPDSENLDAGIQKIHQRGFRTKLADNLRKQSHFLAGNRITRLQNLVSFFRDPDLSSLFSARGGDGAIHLLPDLLDTLDSEQMKPLVGYSDITLLQLALYHRFHWVSFSGPMVATELGADTLTAGAEQHLWDMVTQPHTAWELLPGNASSVESWHSGSADGPLLGGCLSLICALLGSPYLPDFDGAILIVEDIDESPRHVDRMLHQLRINGIFDRIHGMIIGQFQGCFPENPEDDFTLRELVESATRDFHFPILGNYPYGHKTPDRLTIPIGATVGVSTDPMSIEITDK